MATLAVYNANKEKVGDVSLPDDIFGVEPKIGLLQEIVRWQLAKRRAGNANTKTRAEVRGGGKKPWRQKGTGHARVGSTRNPVWRHGGVAHGPKPKDWSYTLPKKVRRLGLKMALSDKVASERCLVLRDFGLDEIKTRKMAGLLKTFGVQKAVILLGREDSNLELSVRNIPGIKVLKTEGLNVYDLIKHEYLMIHEPALEQIQERLEK